MSYTDKVIHTDSHKVQGYLKNCQLQPVKVFNKAINVLASEIPSKVLNETEWNAPQEVEKELFAFLGFSDNLVFLDKVKHCNKRTSMNI